MAAIGSSKNPIRAYALGALSTLVWVSGCAPEAPPLAAPGEGAVLSALYRDGVQPALAEMSKTAGGLRDAVAALCDEPSAAALEGARDAWRSAHIAWRQALPFLFGPADALELQRRLDTWPVNEQVLGAIVTAPDVVTEQSDFAIRGYGAVEYLLFAPTGVEEATTGLSCAYLGELTEEIATRSAQAGHAWEEGFAAEFKSAGDGEPFLTPAEAISLAYAEVLNVTETLLRERIGIPSGFFVDRPRPEYLAAGRSGEAVPAFAATLAGVRAAVMGDGETGLTRLVAAQDGIVEPKNPRLAADIERQFDRISATLARLARQGPDLQAALSRNPRVLRPLYRQIQGLQDQLVEASLVLELDVRTPIEGLVGP